MFADLDYGQGDLREDVLRWTEWMVSGEKEEGGIGGVGGFRLDAAKHYSRGFQRDVVRRARSTAKNSKTQDGERTMGNGDGWVSEGRNRFWTIIEYWSWNSEKLAKTVDAFEEVGGAGVFDVQLMYNFFDLSNGKVRDLREMSANSLVNLRAGNAVVSSSFTSFLSLAPFSPIPHCLLSF